MVKISGHMVAEVVVDHNQGLMTKTKNGRGPLPSLTQTYFIDAPLSQHKLI